MLLLDEPFSALDVTLRHQMHDLLRHIRTDLAPTMVLVTHDHSEATALGDRLAVLSAGRVLQHADVETVYTRPASLEVFRMLGGTNEVPGVVQGHRHHSSLGAITLPVDVRPPEGPATLVFRQEAVIVSQAGGVPASSIGEVVECLLSGPRRRLGIRVPPVGAPYAGNGDRGDRGESVLVRAEVPTGTPVTLGDQVGVGLPSHAVAVIPGTSPPSGSFTQQPATIGLATPRMSRCRPGSSA